MTRAPLSIGFSPCPNDTFLFHALVHGVIPTEISLQPPLLADVETLNEWALQGRLDVTKLSFHALGHVLDEYVLLRSGSALGRGCGPLLVARADADIDAGNLRRKRVALPGRLTTAAMLLALFAGPVYQAVAMPFDRIMPAVAAGEVECGVIIHESRFTYADHGLVELLDLGSWWEKSSGLPIPLGGIAARRSLGAACLAELERAIAASVEYAELYPFQSRAYVQAHAQEMADDVMNRHIALYVNSFSKSLGREGEEAIRLFFQKAREAQLFPCDWKNEIFTLQ